MTAPLPTDDLIVAYVYGELRDDEAKAFEDRLEGDADLRAEVEGLIAAREMLDVDKENADAFGFDEPPAHLFDAIMRAEPMVRPREMTAAAAAVQRPTAGAEPTWFHRVRLWIVGGGAVLTATAAVMLLVKDADLEAPAAMAPAMEKSAQDSAEAMPPEPPPSDPAAASPEPKNEVADDLGRAFGDKSGKADLAAASADNKTPLEDEEAKPAEQPAGPSDAPAPDTLARKNLEPAKSAMPRAPARSSRAAGEPMRDDFGGRSAKPKPSKKKGKKVAPAPRANTFSFDGDDDDLDLGDEGAGDYGLGGEQLQLEEKRRVANDPAPPPPPAAKPAPVTLDAIPSTPISGSGASTSGSTRSAPTGVVKVQDVAKARVRQRAKRPASKLSSKDKMLEKERRGRAEQASTIAMTSGGNALRQNRPLEALTLFTRAEKLDTTRHLGLAPHVGKMKALEMLDRCKEVMSMLGVVEKQKLSVPYVIDGLFTGAACAEQLGYDRRAERIYERLAGYPAATKAAQPNLRRMRQKRVDFDAPAAAEADAESASEP